MKKMWRDKEMIQSKRPAYLKSAVFLFLTFLAISCGNKNSQIHADEAIKYTCSMHPEIIRDKPGICPICGMDLVPLQHRHLNLEIDSSLKDVIKPTNQNIISNIKTITVNQKTIIDTMLLDGKINFDTNNLNSISSRISGRIEKLFVHYNFEKINKGQKILEIYSPELAAAQQELIFLNKNNDAALLNQAKQKLRLLGVAEKQISEILKSGKVNYKIPVYSNFSGYLIDPKIVSSSNESQNMNTNETAISLLEGQYIQTGDVLFKLFNNKQVRAEFYVDAQQMESVKKGNPVEIITQTDTIRAKIDLIQVYFNSGQKFNVLRSYLNNIDQKFKVGQLIKGHIYTKPKTGLYIPVQSVYQAGTKSIVFIRHNNILKAKEVFLASKTNSLFLIQSGLSEGDEIATNASYLIDTESFIQSN